MKTKFILLMSVILIIGCRKAQKKESNVIPQPVSAGEKWYDLSSYYPKEGDGKIKYIGESPMNEATVQVFQDGTIRIYHTPERFSDKVMMSESVDNGYTFSSSKEILRDSLISQYPRRTLIDDKGHLHLLVFKRKVLDVYHTVSMDNGITWSPLNLVTKGRIGAIRGLIQTESGRLIFGFHRRVAERKPPFGSHFTSSVYSDDYGKTWVESSSELKSPVYENYNGNNYGLVEPNIVQLNNGNIKMFGRTQTGYLYESVSKDEGMTWEKAKPSIFKSSNSPANIFKIPNGNLLLTWCNSVDSDPSTFGRIYTNRETLHMAISKDDGKTWKGFREVIRIPSRNDQSDMVREDSGVSYPNVNFTKEGKIILVCGQGEKGGGRSIFLIDPLWLEETKIYEDFSTDLEKWSCYSFVQLGLKPHRELGATIIQDSSAKNGKVLLLNKEKGNMFSDGAVLNFPMSKKGEISMRIKLRNNTHGVSISLTDHYRHPNDVSGDTSAMYTLNFNQNSFSKIKPDKWIDLKLIWNIDKSSCNVFIGNEKLVALSLLNATGSGISYLRIRNLTIRDTVDNDGTLIDFVEMKSN
jgi:hypothetical protein